MQRLRPRTSKEPDRGRDMDVRSLTRWPQGCAIATSTRRLGGGETFDRGGDVGHGSMMSFRRRRVGLGLCTNSRVDEHHGAPSTERAQCASRNWPASTPRAVVAPCSRARLVASCPPGVRARGGRAAGVAEIRIARVVVGVSWVGSGAEFYNSERSRYGKLNKLC